MMSLAVYQEKDWLYQQYVLNNMSASRIAEMVGCSIPTVCKWLDRHGIPRRSHSDFMKEAWEEGVYDSRSENPNWQASVAFGTRTPHQEREPLPSNETDTVLIPLTQGKFALVDLQDADWLSQYKWCAGGMKDKLYAIAQVDGQKVYMHRLIMGFPEEVDHRNRKTLDNRRNNLRVCTHRENLLNAKLRSDNTSGYRGVSWSKVMNKWKAHIQSHGHQTTIGYYESKESAARAYDTKAHKLHGEFASLNFPEEV
jgi:hypothetical protein